MRSSELNRLKLSILVSALLVSGILSPIAFLTTPVQAPHTPFAISIIDTATGSNLWTETDAPGTYVPGYGVPGNTFVVSVEAADAPSISAVDLVIRYPTAYMDAFNPRLTDSILGPTLFCSPPPTPTSCRSELQTLTLSVDDVSGTVTVAYFLLGVSTSGSGSLLYVNFLVTGVGSGPVVLGGTCNDPVSAETDQACIVLFPELTQAPHHETDATFDNRVDAYSQVIEFGFSPTPPSAGKQVTFTAGPVTAANLPVTYSWDFNNDGTGDAAGPGPVTHTYSAKGNQYPRLAVTDSAANTVNLARFVRVDPQPLTATIVTNATKITVGQRINFRATITGGTTPYAGFQWVFCPLTTPASCTPRTGTTNPTAGITVQYTVAGQYNVTFRARDANFVNVDAFKIITVNPVVTFDYSVSVDPTSGKVTQGESLTLVAGVSVTLVAGTTESVSLSAVGLPSGATATFTPPSGNPTFTSSLSIQTLASTPTGSFPVTIRGTSATNVVREATFTLTVNAAFDYSISVSPPSGKVTQGQSVEATVTVTLVSGTTESVSLQALGLPSGATSTFTPPSGSPSFTSSLTIQTVATTPTGMVTVTIRGTSATGLIREDTFQLTVNPIPPGFDYAVTVDPTSGKVMQGESAGTTVTVTLLQGTSETVTLTAVGLPSGATATFTPSSGTPSFTSSLSIQTMTSTPTGTFTITVRGTSSTGLIREATFSLEVNAPFNYSLTVTPLSAKIVPGTRVPVVVGMTLLAGQTETVSLTALGIPAASTATFNPSSGMPTFQSELQIQTSDTTPTGEFLITIRGTSATGLVREATFTLTVNPPPFDYSIDVDPTSGKVMRGESVRATVMVSLVTGTAESVSLSAVGLPSGATATFTPSSGTPSFNSDLSIQTSSTTPGGTFSITIRATSLSGVVRETSFSLTVNVPVLTADLVLPLVAYETEPASFTVTIEDGTAPFTCEISFGDSGSETFTCSSGQIVSHAYASAGSFTVTLRVTGSAGEDSGLISKTLNVEPEPAFARGKLSWKHHLTMTTQTFVGKVRNPSSYTVTIRIIVSITRPSAMVDTAVGTFTLGPGELNTALPVNYDTVELGKHCFTATIEYSVDANNDGVVDLTGTGPNSKSGCFARV